MKQLNTKHQWGKRGNFSIIGAFSIGLVLGFAALVVDVGQLYWVRNRNQITAEAAALAAVKNLNQTSAGLSAACRDATALVTANQRTNNEYSFIANCNSPFASSNEIRFGVWDEIAGNFTESTEPLIINAVKVNISRSTSKGNSVQPLLMSVMSVFGGNPATGNTVSSGAVAVSQNNLPAGEANIFPMAANSCGFFKSGTTTLACGREIVMGDNPGGITTADNCPNNPNDCVIDSSGNHFNWTTGTDEHGGTSTYRDMANALIDCIVSGDCSDTTHISIGDEISIQGGNHSGAFNSGDAELPGYLTEHGTIDVQIAIFDGGNCSNNNNNDEATVVGFGTFRINKIVSTGSSKFIRGTIICDTDVTQPGDEDAENFGTFGSSNGVIVK